MQRLRDLMRGALARSLRSLEAEDRLAAALPLVFGSALASHCEIDHLDDSGRLHVRVTGSEWLRSLLPVRDTLQHDLQRVAGVPLTGLHFMEIGSTAGRFTRNPARPEGTAATPRSAQPTPRKGRQNHA